MKCLPTDPVMGWHHPQTSLIPSPQGPSAIQRQPERALSSQTTGPQLLMHPSHSPLPSGLSPLGVLESADLPHHVIL